MLNIAYKGFNAILDRYSRLTLVSNINIPTNQI
nr:MAG TPA: hypothetical protein [Caudoviricetes sp.]